MHKFVKNIHNLKSFNRWTRPPCSSLQPLSAHSSTQYLPFSSTSISCSLSALLSRPRHLSLPRINIHTTIKYSSRFRVDDQDDFDFTDELDSVDSERSFNYRDNGYKTRFENNDFGNSLKEVNYQDLEPFPKHFYDESPISANRPQSEIVDFYEANNITLRGRQLPNPVLTFEELKFSEDLLYKLKHSGFDKPTVIQSVTWPITLSGRNVVGIAQTGSGKTLSFLLPAYLHMQGQSRPRSKEGPVALVICPTRELAKQCGSVAAKFLKNIRITCLFGGGERARQISDLQYGCDLAIATPGRLIDLLEDGALGLGRCTFLVLDEADRMLDMGFEPDIRKVVSQIRPDRQVTMWSATWPKEIRELAKDYLKSDANPVHIKIGSADLTANKDVEQTFFICNSKKKVPEFFNVVRGILDNFYENSDEMITTAAGKKMRKHPRILVFANRKRTCDDISSAIQQKGMRANGLHGDLSQRQRDRVMEGFRGGYFRFMVATDVAARGLDINDIDYVINYDCPLNSETYVHRIGRTGRAGKKGRALTLLTEEDGGIVSDIITVLRDVDHPIDDKLVRMQEWWKQQRTRKRFNPATNPGRRWSGNSYGRWPATDAQYSRRFNNDFRGRSRVERFSDRSQETWGNGQARPSRDEDDDSNFPSGFS